MLTQNAQAAKEFFSQKLAFTTGPYELNGMIQRGEDIAIIDVRLPSDFRKGHIPGAVNLPNGKWHTLAGVPRDKPVYVYCYSQPCKLAAAAAVEFASNGIVSTEVEGGFDTWVQFGLPVEKE